MLYQRQLQTGTILYVPDRLRADKYEVRLCARSRPTRILALCNTLEQAREYVDSYQKEYRLSA